MKRWSMFIVVYILCGVLAIPIAGKADKEMGVKKGSAPTVALFLLGPLGLSIIIVVLVENSFLKPLYEIGYGK